MIKKKAVIAAWQKNSRFLLSFFLCIVSAQLINFSTRVEASPNPQSLELSLFPGQKQAQCLSIPIKNLQSSLITFDSSLDIFLQNVILAIKSKDSSKLVPLFHPRLKINKVKAEQIFWFNSQKKDSVQLSYLNIWAVFNPKDQNAAIPCDDQQTRVFSHNGHKLSFAAQLQVSGEKELGRILLTIVPKDKSWYLASFHFQKWTHNEKSYTHWYEEAMLESQQNQKISAYLKLDIAQKLIAGSQYIQFLDQDRILQAQNQMGSKASWENEIKKSLPSQLWHIIKLDSIFIPKGVGLLLKLQFQNEQSPVAARNACKSIFESFQKHSWFQKINGIKCSFYQKGEDPNHEGGMGSIIFDSTQF